jgi:LPXTG-motif cell wall-anchored protein
MEEFTMKRFVAILLILVLVFALSATAFAGSVTSPEKGNTDANVTPDKGNTSPQTGESFSILWVILAAIAAIGAVLFCGKKLIRVK